MTSGLNDTGKALFEGVLSQNNLPTYVTIEKVVPKYILIDQAWQNIHMAEWYTRSGKPSFNCRAETNSWLLKQHPEM
jgi:hypothetical protein